MNIDLILTEWCFRLPKGYPIQSKDYEVLYKVLLEVAKLSPADAQRIVERAQGLRKQIVTESVELDSIQNQILKDVIADAGKMQQFREFLELLPTEADPLTLKYLNKLSYDQCVEFANILYSTSNPSSKILFIVLKSFQLLFGGLF